MDWEGVNTFVQRLYTSPPPSPWRSQSIGIFSESDTCRSCLFNIILGKVYMYIWSTCNNIQQTTSRRYASDNILYQRQTSVWYTSTYPEMLYFLWIKNISVNKVIKTLINKPIFHSLRYDVELYQRIEHLISKKLPLYKTEEEEVMQLMERVTEAQRYAKMVSFI